MEKYYLQHVEKCESIKIEEINLINKQMDSILLKDEIKMEEIQKLLTPIISHCEIFISYSHKDENYAFYVANELMKKGKKVFLDKMYWKSIDEALKKYDNKNTRNSNNTYDYEKRNKSTASFHMILSDSILKTIKNCSIFILIENDDVSKANENNDNEILYKTYSPWIFLEVEAANGSYSQHLPKSLIEDQQVLKFSKINFPINLYNFTICNNVDEILNKINYIDTKQQHF